MKDNINYHTSITNFWLLGIWKDQLATPEVATLLKRRRCLPGEVTTKQVINKTTACCRNVHVSAQFYWISLKNLYSMLLYRSWWIFSIRNKAIFPFSWLCLKINTEIAQSRMWSIFIQDTVYFIVIQWSMTFSLNRSEICCIPYENTSCTISVIFTRLLVLLVIFTLQMLACNLSIIWFILWIHCNYSARLLWLAMWYPITQLLH